MRDHVTEEEYAAFVWRTRAEGHMFVAALTAAWRRDLWPDPWDDPISREERQDRLRRELAVDAYWGSPRRRVIYGGICAG